MINMLMMFATLLAPSSPSINVDQKIIDAIAFVESGFDDCARRGQYRGRFQQGRVFSVDLGYKDSSHVMCNREAARADFMRYQNKYGHLTKGKEIWIVTLHARGPGTVKKRVIPWSYIWRYAEARYMIDQGIILVK